MKALKRISVVVAIIGVALGIAFYRSAQNCEQVEASGTAANQGCINQGTDCRVFGTVMCWSQRHMSWKSEHEPHFVLLGMANRTSLGLAWPPYVVFNSPDGTGHWRMFRIGFRYDRKWRGYIFPTVAAKHLPEPLRY
jgi:hypothetical protein